MRPSGEQERDSDSAAEGLTLPMPGEEGAERTSSPAEWPPPHFEEYWHVRPLGKGGMGQVHLYRDALLDRPVAIKFLAVEYAEPPACERFLIEARAIARLQHPNVVAVHRVGDLGGRPFLVSEYVRGRSLDLVDKPLPWREAAQVGLGLCRGLGAAHRCGVLHRDVKPANAMVAEDGTVKLLDFGLAKLGPGPQGSAAEEEIRDEARPRLAGGDVSLGGLSASGSDVTAAGTLLGTPRYLAPELWLGEPATRRSDLYSLGALLYELCSGAPPRRARTLQDLRRLVLDEDAPPLLRRAPEAPAALAALVDRCLQRDPARRPVSCEELAQALEGLLGGATSAPTPEGNPYRGLRPFEAEHRALFFGRAVEIGAVLERLRDGGLVLVGGDSGVGKSSLCRAGVVPRCEAEGLGDGRRYAARCLVPGRRPLQALADALSPVLAQPEEQVAALLRGDADGVVRALLRLLGDGRGLLLFVDQLEELRTQGDDAEAAQVATLLGHLAGGCPGVRVLATARGDFLTRLATLPGLGPELERSLYILRPLTEAGLREAIVGPAAQKGFSLESLEMLEELVGSTLAAEGGLPLLQFALSELWRARDEPRRLIPRSALSAIGGVAGALARHADDTTLRLGVAEQAAARRHLCRLVTAAGTRATRTLPELYTEGDAAGRVALEALVQGRLVVAHEDRAGEGTYEIAHEALLSGWGTLRRWLAEDSELRELRGRLEQAAQEWQRLGRARDALWGERQLRELAAVPPLHLSPLERAFAEDSRAAVRRRRLRGRALALAAPLLVGLVYGAVRLRAHHELQGRVATHVAEGRQILAEARSRRDQVAAARKAALGRFDARDPEEGERLWLAVRQGLPEVEGRYRRAARAFEGALMLDGGARASRRLLAEVLYEHALVLDGLGATAAQVQEDLAQRLGTYDDGDLGARYRAPARLRLRSSPPGAAVTLARYEEDDGRLRTGAPRDLGPAPLEAPPVPAGSYLLTLRAPGRAEARYPILLGRGEDLTLEVPLPPAAAVPPGFLYVPAGRFLFGTPDDDPLRQLDQTVQPLHEVRTGAYLIGKSEVTFADWLVYLRALPPAGRPLPRVVSKLEQHLRLEELPDGAFRLRFRPRGASFVLREGERLVYPGRRIAREQDWLRLPVTGVSFAEAEAYAAWLDRTGRVPGARLCDEHEWERAARGADGRAYPHGARLRPDEANIDETYGRSVDGFGPDAVGSHPASDSPFGAVDMSGNALELVRSLRPREVVAVRGGGWYLYAGLARSANREPGEPTLRDVDLGFRLCARAPE